MPLWDVEPPELPGGRRESEGDPLPRREEVMPLPQFVLQPSSEAELFELRGGRRKCPESEWEVFGKRFAKPLAASSSASSDAFGTDPPPGSSFQEAELVLAEDVQWREDSASSQPPQGTSSEQVPGTGPPVGSAFQAEVLAVAEAAARRLQQHGCAPRTQVHMVTDMGEGAKGICTLTASVEPDHQSSVAELIALAKDAIYSLTSRGRGVCLLGYKKKPFHMTPIGFDAKLGTVARKRRACRQIYGLGRCIHGPRCWWEHPQGVICLNFRVEGALGGSIATRRPEEHVVVPTQETSACQTEFRDCHVSPVRNGPRFGYSLPDEFRRSLPDEP